MRRVPDRLYRTRRMETPAVIGQAFVLAENVEEESVVWMRWL